MCASTPPGAVTSDTSITRIHHPRVRKDCLAAQAERQYKAPRTEATEPSEDSSYSGTCEEEFLHVVLINPPYEAPWLGVGVWITVPPQGYGGIQWCVAALADGLLELGCRVTILGAPGSSTWHRHLEFPRVGTKPEILAWLRSHKFDVIHDHSNAAVLDSDVAGHWPLIATHHLTGDSRHPRNVVFLSEAQRQQAGRINPPVVRLPVTLNRFTLAPEKSRNLLFLGRVSPWKGAREAAAFASAVGRRLIVAGPVWEHDYFDDIMSRYGETVEWIGEVGRRERTDLLSRAAALLVLSQPLGGPWGDRWCEPGAMVVAEAAASGTPVVATANGCLAEIVPPVGAIVATGDAEGASAERALASLPSPASVRRTAGELWSHTHIARMYICLYERVRTGGEI